MSPKQILLVIFLLTIFMGSSIGYVWSNFERTQLGYDLSQLKKEEMKLRETNRKLRLELAILKSPGKLEALAIGRLGLKQPSADQIIILP
jgi:cell division protein FtsL